MSLSETIQAAHQAQPPQRTLYKSFYAWYDALTEEEQQELDSAILSPDVSTRQLFWALKTHENVPFGDTALYFHASTLRQEN